VPFAAVVKSSKDVLVVVTLMEEAAAAVDTVKVRVLLLPPKYRVANHKSHKRKNLLTAWALKKTGDLNCVTSRLVLVVS